MAEVEVSTEGATSFNFDVMLQRVQELQQQTQMVNQRLDEIVANLAPVDADQDDAEPADEDVDVEEEDAAQSQHGSYVEDRERPQVVRKPVRDPVPKFNGEYDSFHSWLKKYENFAKEHNFYYALLEDLHVPYDEIPGEDELIERGHAPRNIARVRDALFSLLKASEDPVYLSIAERYHEPSSMFRAIRNHYLRGVLAQYTSLDRKLNNIKLGKT